MPDAARSASRTRGSNPVSRLLHFINATTAHAATAGVVAIMVLAFGIVSLIAGFPQTWENAFAAVCAAVTTVMVFTIQHTQSREQIALQLKLDEVIRALPGADDRLVHVEAVDDNELADLEQRQVEHHLAVRANDGDGT